MAKMYYANYQVSSTWDLDEICAELGIDPSTLDDSKMYVKWDTLHITYTDADGEEQEAEFEPNLFSASEEFDWKRPTEEAMVEETL